MEMKSLSLCVCRTVCKFVQQKLTTLFMEQSEPVWELLWLKCKCKVPAVNILLHYTKSTGFVRATKDKHILLEYRMFGSFHHCHASDRERYIQSKLNRDCMFNTCVKCFVDRQSKTHLFLPCFGRNSTYLSRGETCFSCFLLLFANFNRSWQLAFWLNPGEILYFPNTTNAFCV